MADGGGYLLIHRRILMKMMSGITEGRNPRWNQKLFIWILSRGCFLLSIDCSSVGRTMEEGKDSFVESI